MRARRTVVVDGSQRIEEVVIRRSIGGIAWPGISQSGCCCIIGEEIVPDVQLRTHRLFMLAEHTPLDGESRDELIAGTLQLSAQFKPDTWIGRGWNDVDGMRYLNYWNRNVRKDTVPELSIYIAPKSDSDSITYHIDVLSSCLSPGYLVLNWTRQTRLQAEMSRLSTEQNENNLTCFNYPAVAAVGYAVSYLRENPPENHNRIVQRPAERTAGGY